MRSDGNTSFATCVCHSRSTSGRNSHTPRHAIAIAHTFFSIWYRRLRHKLRSTRDEIVVHLHIRDVYVSFHHRMSYNAFTSLPSCCASSSSAGCAGTSGPSARTYHQHTQNHMYILVHQMSSSGGSAHSLNRLYIIRAYTHWNMSSVPFSYVPP